MGRESCRVRGLRLVIFDSLEKLKEVKSSSIGDFIMGDTFYCDWKIIDDELYVKGSTCIYNDWFATKDLIKLDNFNRMYYDGRKS